MKRRDFITLLGAAAPAARSKPSAQRIRSSSVQRLRFPRRAHRTFEHARVTSASGDVFKMKRPKPTATEMSIVQQKTDVRAHVQIHSEYRQIIDAARPDDGKVMVLHEADSAGNHDGGRLYKSLGL